MTAIARLITLGSWSGLIGLIGAWRGYPDPLWPTIGITGLVLLPLTLLTAGLWQGRPYTHALASFVALPYFTHGIIEVWANPAARIYATLEVLLSTVLYLGAMFYSRWRSQELKANIKGTS
mgnify:CR=1 FL=1